MPRRPMKTSPTPARGCGNEPARDHDLRTGGLPGAGRSHARRCVHHRHGRGSRTRRGVRPVSRAAAGIRTRAHHRYADFGSQHHGCSRGHGAGRFETCSRDAGHRFCPLRDGRDRQSSGQEPLHVRRAGPGAADRTHAHRHLVGLGGPAFAVARGVVRAHARFDRGHPGAAAGQLRAVEERAGQWRPGDLHGTQGAVGCGRCGVARCRRAAGKGGTAARRQRCDRGHMVARGVGCARGGGHLGCRRHFRRSDRPAHPVALGQGGGVCLGGEDRQVAGGP